MRTKKEILEFIHSDKLHTEAANKVLQMITVELLLDIRDLLKPEVQGVEAKPRRKTSEPGPLDNFINRHGREPRGEEWAALI